MRYEKYKLNELAKIEKVKGKPLSKYEKGETPYVTGSQSNNGVIGYVTAPETDISKGNCIVVDPIKGLCMYQGADFVGRGFSGASINALYIENMEEQELKDYFPEFRRYEGRCRFQGCRHIHEPGCAVKEALENNEISRLRYEDYLELHQELKEKRRY